MVKPNPQNDRFFAACSESLSPGDTVLHLGFARPDDGERDEIFARDCALLAAATDKELTYVSATKADLVEQLKAAKLIFGGSGHTSELVNAVKTCPEFAELIQGKVYAGSSAGAYLVASKYYSNDGQEVRDGLGILPIKILCHYGNSEFNALDNAKAIVESAGDDLETVVLKDYEWIVREQ